MDSSVRLIQSESENSLRNRISSDLRKKFGRSFLIDSWMISVRDPPESQYMSGCSSRTTVFLAKRASTSDADGPKAFPYQVSASESYWSSQETSATTFLTLLSIRPCITSHYSTIEPWGRARTVAVVVRVVWRTHLFFSFWFIVEPTVRSLPVY